MAYRKRTVEHAVGAASPGSRPIKRYLNRQKMAGIVETAVTVNHEINSPLAAILGNVRLLLRDPEKLDKSLAERLLIIEMSAERILAVTRRLLRITRPDSVEYVEGIRMLDISDDNQRED
jgi:signal transduction histidine kinase